MANDNYWNWRRDPRSEQEQEEIKFDRSGSLIRPYTTRSDRELNRELNRIWREESQYDRRDYDPNLDYPSADAGGPHEYGRFYGRPPGKSWDFSHQNRGNDWGHSMFQESARTPDPRSREDIAHSVGLEPGQNYAGRGPKGYRRADERIKEDAGDCLERHPEIDASEIELDVSDGVIILRGSVVDRATKRMTEDALDRISGVKDIRNELTINKSLFELTKEFIGDAFADASKVAAADKSNKSKGDRH